MAIEDTKNKEVIVRRTGSDAGRTKEVRRTLQALGLNRVGATRTHTLTPSIKGMITRVRGLVTVEENVTG